MVKIPDSPGVQVRPTTQPATAAPTFQPDLPRAISGLGGAISDIARQRQELEQTRQEAFQASRISEHKLEIKRIDNDLKLRLEEIPPIPEEIEKMKKTLSSQRQRRIDELLIKEKDVTIRNSSIRYGKATGVDMDFLIDKSKREKEVEFGRANVINNLNQIQTDVELATNSAEVQQANGDIKEILSLGLQSGYIDFKFIENFEKEQKKIRKEQQKITDRRSAFNQVLDGNLILDPRNKEDKKIINDSFEEILADPNINAEEVAKTLSKRTGIIPDKLKTTISARLFNGNNNQKIQAAELISDLINENPRLQENFTASELAQSTGISLRIESGLTAEQAVTFTEQEIDKNKSAERIGRENQFNREFGRKGTKKSFERLEKFIDDLKDDSGIPFIDPEVQPPAAIESQFQSLTRDFFLNEGVDIQTAEEMAQKEITAEWTLTNIGKKRFQRFAPERFYKVEGVNNKWMETQLFNLIRKQTIESLPKKVLNEEISIEVIADTIVSGKPSYLVLREDQFNSPQIILDNSNNPLIFAPDFTKTKEYTIAIEAREKLGLSPEEIEEFRVRRKKDIGGGLPDLPLLLGGR